MGKILEVHSFDDVSVTSLTGSEGEDAMYVGLGDGRIAALDPRSKARSSGGAMAIVSAHDKKVQHVEINPSMPHLLATASNDGNVKIWDVRMLAPGKNVKGKAKGARPTCLATLPHGQV